MANRTQQGLQAVGQEWGILSRLLTHLSRQDYYSLRHTNRHMLSVMPALPQRLPPIAPPTHNGHPAGPLPMYSPLTIPAVIETRLGGASCNDLVGNYPNFRITVAPGPCPNSHPLSTVLARPCAGTNPITHDPAAGPHLVCADCHRHNSDNRQASVRAALLYRKARLCRKCSKRVNKAYQAADPLGRRKNQCTCEEQIHRRWQCYGCMDEAQERLLSHGLSENYRLHRTHVTRDRKTKRRMLVVRVDNGAVPHSVQDRPGRVDHACPMPGCGEKAWNKTHKELQKYPSVWKNHPESAELCLCCHNLKLA